MIRPLAILLLIASAARAEDPAEAKAIAFLAREVPRWERENHCHSCHNNGDAARALYRAAGLSAKWDRSVLDETSRWLARPDGWEHQNGDDGPFNDRRLARLQFTLALGAASRAGFVADRPALLKAADRLVKDQADDGSWSIEGETIGSPASYGRPLATAQARNLLQEIDPDRYHSPITLADRWLSSLKPETTTDAAAILLRTEARPSAEEAGRRQGAIARLKAIQSSEGGWGPYRNAPPEVFDTALALLALARSGADDAEAGPLIRRGRSYLLSQQQADGSWPGTTRPTGGDSYAQSISTAGWATLALIETRDKP